MKSKFVNQNNYRKHGEKEHTYTDIRGKVKKGYGKSKTVPSQAQTVKQIMELSKKGISPKVLKEVIYEMDYFGEDLNPLRQKNFDLTDMDRIQHETKEFRKKLEIERQEKRHKEKELEKEKIIQEYIKENDINNDGKLDLKSNSPE